MNNPYWDDITFPTKPRTPTQEDDFVDYLKDYKTFDNLFNDALTTLQDLDVPSGPMLSQQPQPVPAGPLNSTSGTFSPYKHAKKPSGTAIFGFLDHNRELSINGYSNDVLKPSTRQSADLGNSISPTQLARRSAAPISNDHLDFNFSLPLEATKPIHINEDDEYDEEAPVAKPQPQPQPQHPQQRKTEDYIVTNSNPKLYKFPPSPPQNNVNFDYLKPSTPISQFMTFQGKQETYPDDIEPLLDSPSKKQRYVPIPVQKPTEPVKRRQTPPQHHQEFIPPPNLTSSPPPSDPQSIPAQPADPIDISIGMRLGIQDPMELGTNSKVYLPPPPASQTTSLSEHQTSPEPSSPVLPHAQMNTFFSSPIHRMPPFPSAADALSSSPYDDSKKAFRNGQFFSDGDGPYYAEPQIPKNISSPPFQDNPYPSLKSSPIKPQRDIQDTSCADDTVTDINETVVQLTPLKSSAPPITPSKNRITLEWSPIISPNAKASSDVRRAIQELSPKRTIKKTSLLPPGELDRYWEGPDENKIFTCTYKGCGKKFTRRYNVRSHIQTHLSDRPFSCSYCPKAFVRQHDLNRHIKSHTVSKHCRCRCGREFTRIEGYKRHLAKGICPKGPDSETSGVRKPSPVKQYRTDNVLDGLKSNQLSEELELQSQS